MDVTGLVAEIINMLFKRQPWKEGKPYKFLHQEDDGPKLLNEGLDIGGKRLAKPLLKQRDTLPHYFNPILR